MLDFKLIQNLFIIKFYVMLLHNIHWIEKNMKFKIIGVLICLIIAISFPAVADTIANDNTRLFESEYTVMIGLISSYSEDGDDVYFMQIFYFFTFLAPGLDRMLVL
jgi:hypothetical protein